MEPVPSRKEFQWEMNASVTLEWTFSPADYFEEPLEIKHEGYILIIDDGKAQARVDYNTYNTNSSMRAALQDALNGLFLGAQLVSRKEYKLSTTANIYTVHPDGRKEMATEIPCGHLKLTAHSPDIKAVDKAGNVILDTKRDRIDKKISLGEKVNHYFSSDDLIVSLLRSHDAAVRDPDNELVHLYEIFDALLVKFGSKKVLCSILGMDSELSRFERLCNDKELKQGRHRGLSGGALRNATDAELSEVRGIALSMIEGYLTYLDNTSRHGNS